MLFSKSGHCYETLIVPIRCEVHNFARKLCRGDQATADDILQETLMKSWSKWEEWEPTHPDNVEGSVRAWLFRIASNVFVSLCRVNKIHKVAVCKKRDEMLEGLHGVIVNRSGRVEAKPTEDQDNADNHFQHLEDNSLAVPGAFQTLPGHSPTSSDFSSPDVKAAIKRLHPQRQLLLNLRYIKRWRLSEIAKRLEVPAPTVRVRLTRVHNRLRPLLARHAREEYGLRGAGVQAIGEPAKVVQTKTDSVDTIVRDDDSALLPVR